MFDQNLIFVAENYVYKKMRWRLQWRNANYFIQVVQQHVLDVVVILHDVLLEI